MSDWTIVDPILHVLLNVTMLVIDKFKLHPWPEMTRVGYGTYYHKTSEDIATVTNADYHTVASISLWFPN